jgi:hypothetical protein
MHKGDGVGCRDAERKELIDEYHRHDTSEELIPNHFYPVKES